MPSCQAFAAALPVLGLAGNVLCQILSLRVLRCGLLRSVYVGFALGWAADIILRVSLSPAGATPLGLAGESAVDSVIYACLGYCYFHFINLGETARRIRIIRELQECPEGLDLSGLLARYNARMIVEARLGRLLRNGQVTLEGNRLRIGRPTVLFMARGLTLLKRLLLGRPSESASGR